jgi:colicin import membrane protein
LNATVATAQIDFLRPKGVDGWRQGLVLALGAHGLLLLALMLSMSWRTHRVDVVEAEMWSEVPRAAQPAARVVPPPEPPPAPEPVPVPPAPAPEPIPQPKAAPEPAPKPAELSVERKAKAEPPKKTKPPKEYFEPDPEPVKKRLAEAKAKPEPKPEPKKAETKPAPKADAKPSPVTPQQAAQQEKERQERLKRMMADLGGEGTPSAGPSAQYAGRIKARIKPNVVFTEEVSNNPLATVEVRCAPDGRIIGRRLLTRSGNTAWDDAVLRAIDRTEVLPLDEKGRIPAIMQIDFRPRDF